ncbi:MAG: hypothetical protein LBI02_02390, partial [Opitutaceae bacterium]|nr:hypothetical protein [Opitutaceae bacterium]
MPADKAWRPAESHLWRGRPDRRLALHGRPGHATAGRAAKADRMPARPVVGASMSLPLEFVFSKHETFPCSRRVKSKLKWGILATGGIA